jgi:hypothetical protein
MLRLHNLKGSIIWLASKESCDELNQLSRVDQFRTGEPRRLIVRFVSRDKEF